MKFLNIWKNNMKPTFRIIAKLDIKDKNLVKGVNFEGLRVVGRPHEFANYYYENGIDEIFYQDVIASLLGRNTLSKIIADSSRDIFVPITVGGGIKSLKDIEIVLKSGADRVSLNSGVLENLDLIKSSIKNFGSSNIIFAIEVMKIDGELKVVKFNGREKTPYKLIDWLKILVESGASEVFLSSINHDGTGKGIDFEILEAVKHFENLSIIYHGGVNSNDPYNLSKKYFKNLSGLGISSLFHYEYYLKQKHDIDKIDTGNTEFIMKKKIPSNINPISINEFKNKLRNYKFQSVKFNV